MKILLVDDDGSILDCLAFLFRKRGHEVIKAWNGEQAVEFFSKNTDIDIVITDLSMPGIDGIEVTKMIKKMSPSVRICVASGKFYGSSRIDALQAGAEKTFDKPVNDTEICEALAIS